MYGGDYEAYYVRDKRKPLNKTWRVVAPIRTETGRNEMIPSYKRNCLYCETEVEYEEHTLLECPLYNDIRNELFCQVEMPTYAIQYFWTCPHQVFNVGHRSV